VDQITCSFIQVQFFPVYLHAVVVIEKDSMQSGSGKWLKTYKIYKTQGAGGYADADGDGDEYGDGGCGAGQRNACTFVMD